jgi:Gram-negative bacterial TonB protein C-terminal
MKAKIHLNLLFTLVVISVTIFSSCKSSFPAAGTALECNGQLVRPILNPTKRAYYPGGQLAMSKFLRENIKLPQETKVKGTVRVAFIVTKDGDICDVRISSNPKNYIDNEVTRVIKMMPKWIPGSNAGEIIDSYYLLDIKF